MRRYDSLPIKELVSDVPVDPVHTRELADSIMSKGQLAPVIVREETREVIDGFHRIAAMKELGFDQVECVLTPCDDEGFWDFRIIQASLHKNVTFARAIDWMDRVFELSPWKERYKNAHILFERAEAKSAPQEVQEWAERKAKVWGLAVGTIRQWLETKEKLRPELLEEAKKGGKAPFTDYREVARNLPSRPELQEPLLRKTMTEDLTPTQIRTVAQALKRAEDKEEVESILRQPISRTEDQLVREAKVEKILTRPEVVKPEREERELKGAALLYWLDLEKMTASARGYTEEQMGALPPNQKEILYQSGEECIREISRVNEHLNPEKQLEAQYRLKEG